MSGLVASIPDDHKDWLAWDRREPVDVEGLVYSNWQGQPDDAGMSTPTAMSERLTSSLIGLFANVAGTDGQYLTGPVELNGMCIVPQLPPMY